jgi:hypothetical protein
MLCLEVGIVFDDLASCSATWPPIFVVSFEGASQKGLRYAMSWTHKQASMPLLPAYSTHNRTISMNLQNIGVSIASPGERWV